MTIEELSASFEGCPLPVTIERSGIAVYRNASARQLSGNAEVQKQSGARRIAAPDGNTAAIESAAWEVALDSGVATVVTYAPECAKLETLQRVFQETPVGIGFLDDGLRYRYLNEQLAALNGAPVEAHIGKTVREVLPHLAPHLEPMLQRVLDTGEPVVDLELRGSDWKHQGVIRHTLVNFRRLERGGVRGVLGCVVEITNLKRTTEELLNQAKIFEQVHDSVIQTDLDGRIRAWNGGAEKMFGYSQLEAVGQHVAMLYFEEDRATIGSRVIEPLMANGRHEVVLRNRQKNGSECWVRLSLSLLRDDDGAPYGMVGYSEDITARLRAETAMQASEARYRRLFEASPVGIGMWNNSGCVVEANDVLLEMMGWDREQLNAGKIQFRRPEPPASDGLPTATSFEIELPRADGSRFPALIGVANSHGIEPETLAYVLDLSPLKAAERIALESREYLNLALEGANLGVWNWNTETGNVNYSQSWAEILGYDPSEIEPTFSSWERLLHPDDRARSTRQLWEHLAGHTPNYQAEHRMLCKSGEWKWVWDYGKVVERSSDGRPIRAAGTYLDITSRKEAELALAQSRERFQAIFDQTFQFIGLISPEGILLEANQTALDFGGLKREDAVDREFWNAYWWTISPGTQEQLKTAIRRAAAGEFVRYEVEVWGAGETVTPIDFSLRPIRNASGAVELMIAEGRDITELKRAQKVINADREKRRLEAVLHSMTKGVVIADLQGNVVSMNPVALNLLGLRSESDGTRALAEFREFELRTVGGEVLSPGDWPLARAIRGETFTGYELEVCRLDTGKRFIASFGAAPVLDDSGQMIQVVQTIRDVTHQHEIERALRESNRERDFALQAGRMKVWHCELVEGADLEMELPAKLLGVNLDSEAPAGVVEIEQLLERVHADDRDALRDFGKHLRAGESKEIEYRMTFPDGAITWLASRGQQILSDRGEVSGLAGVTWDITERKQAEAEIGRINASLHRLSGELLRLQDEERRHLARELHDGPVQILSGAAMNLSLLSRSANLSSFTRELHLAQECLGWVKQCSEEMRSLAYLLHPPILDELGLVSALRGWIIGFSDRTGLEIDMNLENVGRLGEDCETALFRIAQEALGNVHRHSRSSTASVRLLRAATLVQLDITDEGQGLPAGVWEGPKAGQRLGVGVQGMRERARQLGGQMEIRSRPGGGTLVSVVLPIQEGTQ